MQQRNVKRTVYSDEFKAQMVNLYKTGKPAAELSGIFHTGRNVFQIAPTEQRHQ